jgi:hypothetical protein
MPEGTDHWEDVGGWTILKWILERYDGGGMDWIDLAQDRNQWRTLVSSVKNLRIPQNARTFLSSSTTGGLLRRAQLLVVSIFRPTFCCAV